MSNAWIPMTSPPAPTDPNWINVNYGGYNYCILGNPPYYTGSVLADCTGFAWGRWRQYLGYHHNLSINQRSIWYLNTADGYNRGSVPQLGAVICYDDGASGHVAIVESITYDSNNNPVSCLLSQSVYNGAFFENKTVYANNNYKLYDGYTLQGFIYLPVEVSELEIYLLRKKRKTYKIRMGVLKNGNTCKL